MSLVKKPVNMIAANDELLKSQASAGQELGATDFKVTEDDYMNLPAEPVSSYRTPVERVNGNVMFRRYLDGRLDMDYAVGKVLEAVHKLKEGVILSEQEKVALSVVYPTVFTYVDAGVVDSVRSVNLKLSLEETALIALKVAAQLAEELNWNAGLGGGSVPGRSETVA